MVNKFVEDWSKQLTASLDLVAWTQEQAERSINIMLEQRKAELDSTQKFINQLWEFNKNHNQQFHNIFQNVFVNAFSDWKSATLGHFEEITTKFEELTKKAETA